MIYLQQSVYSVSNRLILCITTVPFFASVAGYKRQFAIAGKNVSRIKSNSEKSSVIIPFKLEASHLPCQLQNLRNFPWVILRSVTNELIFKMRHPQLKILSSDFFCFSSFRTGQKGSFVQERGCFFSSLNKSEKRTRILRNLYCIFCTFNKWVKLILALKRVSKHSFPNDS